MSRPTREAPPTLTIVIPCYNETEVLGETVRRIRELMARLKADSIVSDASGAVFVDDGSTDGTWSLIEGGSSEDNAIGGIKLSRNRGHQNALLAGLLTVTGDVVISLDADLQDDIDVIPTMLQAYRDGAKIVFGVRKQRLVDGWFKRVSAEGYYRFLKFLGVAIVFNHADYRLMSREALEALREYREVNLFLRGIIPQLGFETRTVFYDRKERFAGTSKYPLKKMLALAFEGITSFSVRPLRWITMMGVTVSVVSFLIGIWALIIRLTGQGAVPGWASTVTSMYFLGGVQLLSLGIVGEYIGKIYLETKRRPRFTIERIVGTEKWKSE